MTWLLDVSALLAWLIHNHPRNADLLAWEKGREVAVCPISELGFLRIACNTYGASLDDARAVLADWKRTRKPAFIPCDLPTSEGRKASTWQKTTDFYLANLAARHGCRLATTDQRIDHAAVEIVSSATQ